MERFFKIAFLLGIAFSFLFFITSNTPVFAQEGGGGEAPACPDLGSPPRSTSSTTPPFRCDESIVFQCTNNNCGKDGGAITQGTESFQCVITTFCFPVIDSSGACPAWTTRCSSSRSRTTAPPLYDNKHQASTAGKYQVCPASTNSWASSPPIYQCSAQCYPAPEITPLDKVENPKNVFDLGSKAKLPVHFEWKDNVEKELAKPQSENKNPEIGFCSVESYKYEIPNALLPVADTIPVTTHNIIVDEDECKLASQASYNFRVQACAKGTCGATGTLPFATSNAPQLLSPYDPDWEEGKSAAARFPAEFKWCEYPDSSVKSYALNIYELKKDGTRGRQILLTGTSSKEKTEYFDSSLKGGLNQLGKGASYLWEIRACTDARAKQCGNFSQVWSLVPGGELKAPLQLFPAPGAFVNMTDALKWQGIVFATHYVVNITGGGVNKDFFTQDNQLSLASIWPELALTTPYQWKVAPCGGSPTSQDIEDCKNDDGTVPWSNEQQFITTGAKPLNVKATPTEAGVAGIPLTLDWDDMGGAASYEIVVPPNPRIVSEKSETTLQYPLLKTKTPYSFAVKTCADKLAKVCGPEVVGNFTTVTFALPPLTVPTLGQKEFDPSTYISWGTVFSGNFYSYTLTFLSPSPQEASSECKKTHEAARQIIAENGATVRFRCLGNYTLAVQACIDNNCKEGGGATISTLSVEKLLAPSGGLVPCDRGNDDKRTLGVDERKPCGIEHIFLLIRNLIDFALWKLSLIIVIVMAIVTGAIMFFSFGGPDVITKVKSIWRSVGIGVFILLFSWVFLNLLLGLVGFNITFYGKWYDLPL